MPPLPAWNKSPDEHSCGDCRAPLVEISVVSRMAAFVADAEGQLSTHIPISAARFGPDAPQSPASLQPPAPTRCRQPTPPPRHRDRMPSPHHCNQNASIKIYALPIYFARAWIGLVEPCRAESG